MLWLEENLRQSDNKKTNMNKKKSSDQQQQKTLNSALCCREIWENFLSLLCMQFLTDYFPYKVCLQMTKHWTLTLPIRLVHTSIPVVYRGFWVVHLSFFVYYYMYCMIFVSCARFHLSPNLTFVFWNCIYIYFIFSSLGCGTF